MKILEMLEGGCLSRGDIFKTLKVSKMHLNPLSAQTKQGQILSFIPARTRTEFLSFLSADNLPCFAVTEAKPRLTGSSPEGPPDGANRGDSGISSKTESTDPGGRV